MTPPADAVRIPVSETIELSPPTADDISSFVEYLQVGAVQKTTLRIPHPYRESDAEAFLKIADEAARQHGEPVHFSIRTTNGKAIGGIGFERLVVDHHVEIGYWLGEPYWGQGIMTRTVGAICDFAFQRWNLVRINAHTFDTNVASGRVLLKNGFQHEGVLRKYHCKNGRYIDANIYGLVRKRKGHPLDCNPLASARFDSRSRVALGCS